jgi:hypothetical protein
LSGGKTTRPGPDDEEFDDFLDNGPVRQSSEIDQT